VNDQPNFNPSHDLMLERVVGVRPELLWRGWTEPELLVQWFTPHPWKTVACEIDLRPGGRFSTTMRSPEGQDMPTHHGCFLEIIENRKLLWTDGLLPGYRPSPAGFMTAAIILEPKGNETRYVAIAMHADEKSRRKHEEMGFQEGWGVALDQLVALTKTL
jgi:uncharacterized protein YndB with AHSA1/START domain